MYFLFMRYNIYDTLFNMRTVNIMSMFFFGKGVFSILILLICVIFNPSCRTTCVEDTYHTLTATPFQIGVNNSSKSWPLSANEKTFAEFPFLWVYLQFLAPSYHLFNSIWTHSLSWQALFTKVHNFV